MTCPLPHRNPAEPDPGYYFFQCDLSGADGWTVAARASQLGDPTMLDDYRAGIKPAKVIALMYMQMQGQLPHVSVNINDLPRDEVKRLTKVTDIPDSLYAVCKAVQHGSSYDMGPNTMANNILLQTFKKSSDLNVLWVPPNDCKKVQLVFFKRYPGVLHWQRWVQQQLNRNSTLTCASGHVRTFFGRPGNDQTYKAAYAHEPQANTTYATNNIPLYSFLKCVGVSDDEMKKEWGEDVWKANHTTKWQDDIKKMYEKS